MKKTFWIGIGIAILIVLVLIILRGSEDDWIKDSRGVWIKHGAPYETPSYVKEQQEIINCSFDLYNKAKNEGMNFSSQCLGVCGNYAVDIVHVPRISDDNLPENQCAEYKEGKVTKFIEIDKNGEITRIV